MSSVRLAVVMFCVFSCCGSAVGDHTEAEDCIGKGVAECEHEEGCKWNSTSLKCVHAPPPSRRGSKHRRDNETDGESEDDKEHHKSRGNETNHHRYNETDGDHHDHKHHRGNMTSGNGTHPHRPRGNETHHGYNETDGDHHGRKPKPHGGNMTFGNDTVAYFNRLCQGISGELTCQATAGCVVSSTTKKCQSLDFTAMPVNQMMHYFSLSSNCSKLGTSECAQSLTCIVIQVGDAQGACAADATAVRALLHPFNIKRDGDGDSTDLWVIFVAIGAGALVLSIAAAVICLCCKKPAGSDSDVEMPEKEVYEADSQDVLA